jgi:octaprenyl-diphosphate synthase
MMSARLWPLVRRVLRRTTSLSFFRLFVRGQCPQDLDTAADIGSCDPVEQTHKVMQNIRQLVEEDLARVEEIFEAQFRSDVGLVGEIGRYIREGGGKRIRPALLLLACRLCGYRGERAITLASVVEFIHTATLLHDDIIDEATVRRGRRSVNSRWGNDITVLLGDYLYTKSMAMALSQDNLRILRLLSEVTLRMIEGEILEIERNGDLEVRVEDHMDIMRRKTADLFSACMRIGAILGDVGEERERALHSYGMNLGLCFQMVDDLLDFTAEEATLGKPVANDLREGKLTLPMIFLLRRAGTAAAPKLRAVLEDRGFDRVPQEEIVRLAREHGALEEAREMASLYAEKARRDLQAFDRSPYREALEALPDFILSRDH